MKHSKPKESTEPKLEDIQVGKLYRVTSRWCHRAVTDSRAGKFALVVAQHEVTQPTDSGMKHLFRCLVDEEYVWLIVGELTWVTSRACDCRKG